MHNLTPSELKDFINYSKNRCTKIVSEHTNDNIYYYRGLYKGYIYIIKLINHLLTNRINIKRIELYNIIKLQKNNIVGKYHKEQNYIKGITNSLYDCLNYIS